MFKKILAVSIAAASFSVHAETKFDNEFSVNVSNYNGGSLFIIDSSKVNSALGSPTSELDYQNDLNMFELSTKNYVTDEGHYLQFKVQKSMSNPTGTIEDKDWLDSSNPTINDGRSTKPLASWTTSKTEAEAVGFEALLGKSFRPNSNKFFSSVDVYGGVGYWREDYTAYGVYYNLAMDGSSTGTLAVPYDTKALEYQTENIMVKFGITTTSDISEKFSLKLNAEAMPYIDYTGEDNHPLRSDLNSPSVLFDGEGYGYQASIGLNYDISENLEVGAHYKYMYMKADGDAEFQFASGNKTTVDLTEASTDRQAVGLSLTYKF